MQAILVVSFGSSHVPTLGKTIFALEQALAKANPDCEIRRAFTSEIIRKKLREEKEILVDNLAEALERLEKEGYRQVICQPTYVINGIEYEAMRDQIASFRHRFDRLLCSKPLLSSPEDYDALTQVIRHEFSQITNNTALVLMGHGSAHPANSAYAALDYRMKTLGYSHFFVGTVEGYPDFSTILAQVQDFGVRRILLAPLMIVAGEHANKDLAGNDAASWKMSFRRAGFQVKVILRGLGEYSGVREIFCEHLAQARRLV